MDEKKRKEERGKRKGKERKEESLPLP